MHFMFPHVLSTETEPNTETTMGFTCQPSTIIDDDQHCRTINLIKSTTPTSTIPSAAAAAASVQSDDSVWRRICARFEFLLELLRQCERNVGDQLRWQPNKQQQQQSQQQQQQQQLHQYVSIFLCFSQKIERYTNTDIVPSSRTWDRLRWPIDQLCIGAEMCYRWRGSACDCMPSVAMARFALCKRTETHTDVPKRIGSNLRLLQSNALVSTLSIRYRNHFFFSFSIYFQFACVCNLHFKTE